MPGEYDKDAYAEPPTQTPVWTKKSALPDPSMMALQVYHYAVDLPVIKFRAFLDSLQMKNRPAYYHQRFRRVPDLTECEEGDYVCYYEAEMQWRRDNKVDQEIMNVMRERMIACKKREGVNYLTMCSKEMQQFDDVFKSYSSRYGNLGAHANARKCLMKQKERMIAAQTHSA